MDEAFLKVRFDPDTRAVLEDVKFRLIASGLIDRELDPAKQFVLTLKAIILASSMLPLPVRCFFMLCRPARVWRIRRTLKPMRSSIRARLTLPDPDKPWIEDHEAFRFLLHGF